MGEARNFRVFRNPFSGHLEGGPRHGLFQGHLEPRLSMKEIVQGALRRRAAAWGFGRLFWAAAWAEEKRPESFLSPEPWL